LVQFLTNKFKKYQDKNIANKHLICNGVLYIWYSQPLMTMKSKLNDRMD